MNNFMFNFSQTSYIPFASCSLYENSTNEKNSSFKDLQKSSNEKSLKPFDNELVPCMKL